MNLNYSNICHYCGTIYKSCRSTSKYCCKEHNSLYHLNGPQRVNAILNSSGVYIDYNALLERIYYTVDPRLSWRLGFTAFQLIVKLGYNGPLPEGDELLLVSGFLLRKVYYGFRREVLYKIKPFYMLSKSEKASSIIVKGGFE